MIKNNTAQILPGRRIIQPTMPEKKIESSFDFYEKKREDYKE